MSSARGARLAVAILVVATISSPVFANDAGTGGDAGNSMSTASPLSATNATYSGNLSTSDTDDFYSIAMPNGTGLAVGLTSPAGADFDLALIDSSSFYIDTSALTTSYDEVTSNGTNVGGTTVYINVEQWTGT